MQPSTYLLFFSTLIAPIILASADEGDLELLILHNNDMHSRFEETERNSGTCKPSHRNKTCIGGFARTAHEIRKYRKMADEGKGPKVLYLNAGDSFVGTAWFTLFTYNITSEFMNLLRPDAASFGNHEFDTTVDGDGLAKYVNKVNFPIVAANLDFTEEPALQKIPKSVILDVSGRKVGIIGYLTPDTKLISSPGKTIFLDEVDAIKKESERLDQEGIKIIIAVGHSGYLVDQKIAKEVPLVDVVVGGHTNTFLWNGDQPDKEKIEGPYPTVVTQLSGKKVPVVQAYAYTKYLGRLNVTFNSNGDLTKFYGLPELLEPSIPQDEDFLRLLDKYRPEIEKMNKEIVGASKVLLDGDASKCRYAECNFGNLFTDALVAYISSISPERWTQAPIGLSNGGSFRNTIDPANTDGKITRGELLGVFPFGNQVVTLTLNGSDLIKTLELGVRSNGETSRGEFLQVSGLKVIYDRTRPPMSRVVSVKVRCGNCSVPTYRDVDPQADYRIVTTTFLSTGGDGHTVLKYNAKYSKTEDLSDIDVIVWYFRHYSPVFPEVQGRIAFTEETSSACKKIADYTTFGLVLYSVLYNVG